MRIKGMRWKWAAIITLVLAAGVLSFDYTSQPPRNLRRFDPHHVGQVETGMWMSYYGHNRLKLFSQMADLLRDQYHLSRTQSLMAAYRAAHAAVVFQRGTNRTEYELALPDLVRFYEWVLGPNGDVQRVAKLELEWWIVHRERARYGREALEQAIAELQAAIYAVPAGRFREHARLRAEAMLIRDERATAGEVSATDWARIAALLDQSWTALHAAAGG